MRAAWFSTTAVTQEDPALTRPAGLGLQGLPPGLHEGVLIPGRCPFLEASTRKSTRLQAEGPEWSLCLEPGPQGFSKSLQDLCVVGAPVGPSGPRRWSPAADSALPPVSSACGCDLAEGGFFVRQGEYICTRDYQRLYGTRCFSCDQFIEGEVVSALGKTYHPDCFVCAVCR